jgi:hypothetical protein
MVFSKVIKTYRVLIFALLTAIFLLGCSSDDAAPPAENNQQEEVPVNIGFSSPVADNVSQISAEIYVQVTADVPEGVLAKGLVWGTDPSPTVDDNMVDLGSGSGNISFRIEPLAEQTRYYVRAFAESSEGVVYSDQVEFDTLAHILGSGAVLTTQAEVDAYGAQGYTRISGPLEISGSSIVSLESLNSILLISGYPWEGLTISQTGCQDLSGLDNLAEVYGEIRINENTNLGSLQGLNRLKRIWQGLRIYDNALLDLQGLENLETMGLDSVYIEDAEFFIDEDGILDFQGLNKLAYVHGGIPFTVSGCNSLRDLGGLENAEIRSRRILIEDNNSLRNLVGLAGVGKNFNPAYLTIRNNPSLENFLGLDNLSTQDRIEYFTVENNESLKDFTGLSRLQFLNFVTISNNASLTSFQGFGVKKIFYDIEISDNPQLTSLNGFDNLDAFGTYPNGAIFTVANNQSLVDFCALQYLFTEGFYLGGFPFYGNAYNPTPGDIENGNCSI